MSWEKVKGHDSLVQGFKEVVQRGRLAHAYLFIGPPGIGKRLFARELAKALLCEKPPDGTFDTCNQCPACKQIEAATHPDFLQISRPEDKHEMPIEEIRQLCAAFGLKPARGKGKIALVDDADDFNEESANCFLKTLEEPPPGSVLILIATRAERQLATIVSRCQVIRFRPLPPELVAELLRKQGVDAVLIDRLVRLSGGSPGQALELADPALWDFRRKFLAELARPRPDSVAVAQTLAEFVEEAGKESAAQRRRSAQILRLLIEFLNDAVRVSLGSPSLLAEKSDVPALQALAHRLGPDRLMEMVERCLEADFHLDRRVQLVLVQEALMDALGEKLLA